jgi:hypothetical protein
MTWHADQTEGRPVGDAKQILLERRAKLVAELEALKASPLPSKSAASAAGRHEDLIEIAKKITAIDKKLGRL